ncbi:MULTISPECIES: restriction endonuclease subunit S [Marinobacter]|jgi:restriction endonuclease S subunit|uniref:restriction endonuclease subunit S n=1 Tax=Marinobacter TaxID=2742 RepID=UPI000FCAF90E|nr:MULTISPECIES: restriction endonuclease subunit S [Marinobacter]MCZ4285380.1 restriction endonuclease subunit S [Marinobacter salarius]RUT76413.1 restriction endonuclease subunit S [Marinobacter sp. NP-6]|tara:strand:- start:4756 stop:6771 length:2016 start_codon:yes stop_codon:yes gene_type:complete
MITTPLQSVATVVAGQSPESSTYNSNGEGLPFFQGKADFQEKHPRVRMWCTSEKRKEAYPGDILISVRAPVGAVNICDQKSIIGRGLAAIRPSRTLDGEFLFYYLKANEERIDSLGTGSTFKAITQATLKKISIPLPPLDDQKRIAYLLGKVENLIVRRKQHLKQLDDLLKSVFLDMFGPQAHGYADWPLVEIKDLAANHKRALRTGPFGSNLLHSEFTTEGDVAVLGIDNAVQNRFVWGEQRFITHEKYKQLENYRIFPEDVIITIMGTIGRSAVVPDDIPLAVNTKHLAAITLNKKLANPWFISYSVHSSPFILNQFKSKNRGAIMSGLNLGIIKGTQLKRPPIDLQNKFADTHAKVDKLKNFYLKGLTDLEELYGALSQHAFKGGLDLSRVPLPESKKTVVDLAQISAASDRTMKASKSVIDQLNDFNGKHNAILKALQAPSALAGLDIPALRAAREMAEQASLWRTPLDELKNMNSIARATEALAASSGVQKLTQEMASINESTKLAKQIADSLPKLDMGWLREQQAMIEAATQPFKEMQKSMAALALPDETARALKESDHTMRSLQAALPDTADWMPQLSAPAVSVGREDEDEPRYIFTRHDVLQALVEEPSLSVKGLMGKLTRLETITQQGYERIKKLIFELLNEGEIEQLYNDEDNSIALRALV